MTVREEAVRLSLDDNFTSALARATAEVALFKKALDSLNGETVTVDLDEAAESTEKLNNAARNGKKELNSYSGRLKLIAEAVTVLGPALIPLGASIIPALTASIGGLVAAGGALSVTLLAVAGLGDGLKALDTFQLDPTAANLSKLRIEMEKLGPAGAHFAHFLDKLEPEFHDLQNVARAGLFPGVEDGIKDLLEKLPQVREFVANLADAMGDLSKRAGDAITGDRFAAFFKYVQTEARPILEAFATATGNVLEGLGNMLVAFAPATRSFTDGMVRATEAFANWSKGLESSQGFQNFLQYIREAGPQAAHFIGSFTDALVGILHAAAPFGKVVLPALSGLLDLFGAIASSPVGPPLFAAAAGLTAFNRAAKIFMSIEGAKLLPATFELIGMKAATTGQKLAALGVFTAGAVLAIGTVSDAMSQLDSMGRSSDTLDATVANFQDLNDTVEASNLGKYAEKLHIDLPLLTQDLAEHGKEGEYVQKVLDRLSGSSHGFSALLKAEAGHVLPFYTDSAEAAYDARKDLLAILDETPDGVSESTGAFTGLARSLREGASAALDLSQELSDLNGWFDKRDAIRNYRGAIDDLKKAIDKGFGPKFKEKLDAVGRGIVQIASQIKNPAVRARFLEGARAKLEELAKTAGPKAREAIQRVIDQMDKVGLTKPKKLKLDVDKSKVDEKLGKVETHLRKFGTTNPDKPKLDVDKKPAEDKVDKITLHLRKYGDIEVEATADVNTDHGETAVSSLQSSINSLHGRSVDIYVTTHRATVGPGSADGGTVEGPRHPYGDKMVYTLAPGEEVISNRYGQADRHRSLLKAINSNRLADGGTAGNGHGGGHMTMFTSPYGASIADNANSAAKALHLLEAALKKSEKALGKEKAARDRVQDSYNSLSSTVTNSLRSELFQSNDSPFAASMGAVASTLGTLTSDIGKGQQFTQLLAQLKQRGLSGGALQALLETGNVSVLQQFASASDAQLAQYQSLYSTRDAVSSAAGTASADTIYGAELARSNAKLDKIKDEVRGLRHDVKMADKNNQKAQEKNAKDVKDGVNGAASAGHHRGKRGPR